jgi:serine phosphatase RsbU (regulator of sigma subunit)
MNSTDRLVAVERAMLDAPAHSLGDVLAARLRFYYDASSVEIHLADYRQAVLAPVIDEDAADLPVVGSSAGEAFTQQVPVVRGHGDDVVLHLPVSTRGDRLGVLTVEPAWQPAPEVRGELAEVATLLAHTLAAADAATDRFHRVRRRERLTLAAEMQWQLLPGRGLDAAEFRLAGQLEPAYAVRGDNFDWSADDGRLSLAMTNGFGEGVEAAMLTSLAISALRNARRASLPPAEQVSLADQAVWAHHTGNQHVSTLLLEFDLDSGRVAAVDAGSPSVWLLRGAETRRLALDQQLPLGMFEGTVYTEQEFAVRPGDRLLVLSDGALEALADGRRYGERRVERMIRSTRLLAPTEVVRNVISDLLVFHQGRGLVDDAAVVCLDWLGKGEG